MSPDHLSGHVSMDVVNGALVLRVAEVEVQGPRVTVIVGGNDGILITIDANGNIVRLPSQGPGGDPEVRKAVTSIVQGIQMLTRIANGTGR